MKEPAIHVGLSGFGHPQWGGAGVPTLERLRAYAKVFHTVEITQTFYRDPLASAVRRWRERVSGDFTFTVLASRLLTHILRLQQADSALERMWQAYKPFGSALRCVTFQLPSTLHADKGLLDRFSAAAQSSAVSQGLKTRLAFEFRHRSWHRRDIQEMLRDRGIAVATHDMPDRGDHVPELGENGELRFRGADAPDASRWLDHGAATFFLLRMYGSMGGHPGGEYGKEGIMPWTAAASAAADTGAPVFINIIGDESAGAVRDGLALERALDGQSTKEGTQAQVRA